MLINKGTVLAAVVFASGSVTAAAQTQTTGSIEGTVTDQTPAAAATACSTGVVVKSNDCLPPGRAKRLFKIGQRVPPAYRYTPLMDIPMALRRQIPSAYLTGDYQYIYRDGAIYLVSTSGSKADRGAVAGVLYASFHNND